MSTNEGDQAGDDGYALRGSCATCGFVPDDIGPGAAIDALQSLPSRWRSVLAFDLTAADPEAVLTGRPSATTWTALEHAGHVRDVVHALDIRLQRVLREDEPTLPETHVTPPSGANEQGVAVVLAALTVSSDQLAATIARTPADGWTRRGRRRGASVTALDLVREAVHEGAHHLEMAAATLAELRSAATTLA